MSATESEVNTYISYSARLLSGLSLLPTGGYIRLAENVAPAALHDSGHVVDPPKCHPNTRVAIIKTIIDWASSTIPLDEKLSQKPILWLKGGAGAGKSAIARSVAEQCSKEGLLLGAFFFGAADTTRNHVGRLVATLTYQVCRIFPEFRGIVSTVIEDDPLVFSRSIGIQFTTLLIRPLSTILAKHSGTTKTPRLIIIDGLDECSANINSQQDLLFTLQEVTSSTSLLRFLVCSRPESHLNNAFSSSRMANIHYKILLDDDYSAYQDIKLYLQDKFRDIKEGNLFKRKLPTTWPSPEIIWDLAHKSSGQFIYASTVVRYVESPRHRPNKRLDAILNLRVPPPFKDLPFTELDALYRHIISQAEDPSTVLDILSFPVLFGEFDVPDLEKILQLEEGDVEVILADLQSLVVIDSSNMMVRFSHQSLEDFLCDSQRAGDLYREPSAMRVQHTAWSISAVSTTFAQHGIRALSNDMPNWIFTAAFLIESTIHDLNGEKARYISSDFLQAARQFPLFDLIKQMHTDQAGHQYEYTELWGFFANYLIFLRSVKDVEEPARLVYLQHIQQYCEAVLSLLENELSEDWKSHFIYTYYHLLGPRLCRRSSQVWRIFPWEGGTFSDFVYHISHLSPAKFVPGSRSFDNHLSDVLEISNQLTKGAKRETIFALSASFCLTFLCDNRSTAPDTRRIFQTRGIDQTRRREHPWRWRRMIPRRRSLGNQPVIMEFGHSTGSRPKEWHERLGNMRKAFRDVQTYSGVLASKIYTIPEFLHINKHRSAAGAISEKAKMAPVHALVGPSPSHIILVREVRTAGDDMQD
ncbi:hypothetical protein CPC08DRAFT_767655 [Agrocybe pediades]|nr:hypothetical protein CPC08DRAFT_767655 [Agrocybe pediades]